MTEIAVGGDLRRKQNAVVIQTAFVNMPSESKCTAYLNTASVPHYLYTPGAVAVTVCMLYCSVTACPLCHCSVC